MTRYTITTETDGTFIVRDNGKALHRPTTNGSGMYDLCMDLISAADNRDAAGVDFDRGLQTPRRMKAVETLIAQGWKWDGSEWTTPAAAPAGEAVEGEQYQNGYRDGYSEAYGQVAHDRNVPFAWYGYSLDGVEFETDRKHCEANPDYWHALYTTPPAPVQAAPQEGEAVAYLEIGPGGYLDLGTDRSDDSLLSMPPGKYMLGIIGHPSGDAVGAALRFLGELETVGNARAGEVARGLRKVAAHPSACELGGKK